ncbi:XRE family transcriptional regulator [Paenibacillus paeoniae]|uniref:XRE family transcriptional regulator n=1 Tax=Paenibacillus paeoniae TaxID=2292705 RepID=A0A371PEA1_9BACL|nr:XRE family transcriptional regulator [Paenibacillus paeoniae]REK74273.1 XRE family transcriptional regulator [Paenibacillus paeoniae]
MVREAHQVQTVLEYLVMINDQSYSGVGRKLNITPQQFSDWIKKRRPIPRERLHELAHYFDIEQDALIDSNYYAKPLTLSGRIQLHMRFVQHKIASMEHDGADRGDIVPYYEKQRQLQRELKDEIRLARVAELLIKGNPQIDSIIDDVLDELEAGRWDELSSRLNREDS